MSFSWVQGILIIPWAISVGNSLLLGQAQDTFEVGYSWPGVFLLEANGRMDRFLTQLLFPNHISGNGYRTLTANNKRWNCLHFVLNLIFLTKTAINWDWKLLCVFLYFTREANRFYYRAINTVSWKGALPLKTTESGQKSCCMMFSTKMKPFWTTFWLPMILVKNFNFFFI